MAHLSFFYSIEKVPVTGKRRINTEEFAYGATPSSTVAEECEKTLCHVQSPTHRCTFSTFCRLADNLAIHAVAVMLELSLDPEEQAWIIVLDCYAVHISEKFLQWAKEKYPNLVFLYIFAGCTGWLQPLDLTFNWMFKKLLKNAAGAWLSSQMLDQMALCNMDPTKVKLNVSLTHLRPHFCYWVRDALEMMASKQNLIYRGWTDSGMGQALELAHGRETDSGFVFNTESELYLEAVKLNDMGKLFENFTAKLGSAGAEKFLAGRFSDLFSSEVETDIAQGELGLNSTNVVVRPEEPEAALEHTRQVEMFAALVPQSLAVQATVYNWTFTSPEDFAGR
jgi:hypothetical protein